ncbi:sensor histidine kinase [Candidatus Magnetominusculus xianensis]|uniref:histidine kinase n=1 Tax=Candidatus Magnetominusculus xianensis TaxID=1748249 RepID=A0ABR5SD92_9BACT|nr:ATP-binding protein [Candidatus Magnetominusculus xianensis]KWT82918.1 multi-sensor signal transduction histidine kinase [Candidatus Magnetominusculus xianensis]MBF0405320.1 HAMP domain-containing protein [Nitrospirota bacterium]
MRFSTKLSILITGVIILAAIAITVTVYTISIKTIERQTLHKMESEATDIMSMIDHILFERNGDIQMMASDSLISSRDSSPAQITNRLTEYRNNYKFYASLSFFNLDRIRIADTAGLHIGKQHNVVQWSIDTIDNGIVSAAKDIRVAEELNIPIIYFASPVKDIEGIPFGVVVSRMPVDRIFNIIRTSEHAFIKDVEVYLVNNEGLLLYSNQGKETVYMSKTDASLPFKISTAGETIGSGRGIDEQTRKEYLYVYVREQGFFDFKGNNWTLIFYAPVKTVYSFAEELRNKIILVILPVGALSLLLGIFFARTFSKSLRLLRNKALEVGSGNFDAAIAIDSADEIGDLAKAFNQMAENLLQTTISKNEQGKIVESRTAEIININEKLSREIDDRILIERQIRKINEELEEVNLANLNIMNDLDDANKNLEKRVEEEVQRRAMKEQLLIQQSKMAAMGEMIGLIAHQWRQPLNAIGLNVQDMKEAYIYGELNEKYMEQSVDMAMNQISFMSKTIDDFRNFFMPSKKKVYFDVKTTIEELLLMFVQVFKKNDVDISIRTQQDTILFTIGYPNEFKQVILNILNNSRDAITSIRQSDADIQGLVEINISNNKEGNKILISITDNGGGIPDHIIDRIFESYYTTKGKEGTGVGLYMSKTIIETNMDGKLTAGNVDRGAEFLITLNVSRPEGLDMGAK